MSSQNQESNQLVYIFTKGTIFGSEAGKTYFVMKLNQFYFGNLYHMSELSQEQTFFFCIFTKYKNVKEYSGESDKIQANLHPVYGHI